jgi:ATP-binding cassette, subfamily B, bacterial
MRDRIAFRLAVLRVFPYGGRILLPAALIQLFSALAPVAFIIATSAIVGRVPGAVRHGIGSPEWRSLRSVLIVAGILFVAQQMARPLQFTLSQTLAWRIEDQLRERAALASFGPVGVAALEQPETFDTLADLADVRRGTGFGPGWVVGATLMLGAIYLQWALAAVVIGVVYTWWAALLLAVGSLALRVAIRTGFGKHSRYEATFAAARRRRDYYRDLITAAAAGKEVRVFGLLDWLRGRYREQAAAALHPVWHSRRSNIYGSYLRGSHCAQSPRSALRARRRTDR